MLDNLNNNYTDEEYNNFQNNAVTYLIDYKKEDIVTPIIM